MFHDKSETGLERLMINISVKLSDHKFLYVMFYYLQIIPIESSMAENRSRFPLYLHLTLGIVSVILGSFGVLGYMIYGSNVPQILTNTMGTQIPAQMIRVTLIVAVLMTYPLQLYPVIEIAESAFFSKVHSKSQLNEVIAGPSAGASNSSEPTMVNDSETEVLLPRDSEVLEYKVGSMPWEQSVIIIIIIIIIIL